VEQRIESSETIMEQYMYHDANEEEEKAATPALPIDDEQSKFGHLFDDHLSCFDQRVLKAAAVVSQTSAASITREEERAQLDSILGSWSSEEETTDWNEFFVKLRLQKANLPGERREHFQAQQELLTAFNAFVEKCVVVLQLEEKLDVPVSERKVRPLGAEGGGIAGGKKYRCGHVWLKATVNDRGLFSSVMDAQKTAAAELSSMSTVLHSNIRSLNVAISCCVVTRGHFITGTANAPIRGDATLAYGSANACRDVYDRHPLIRQSVARFAERVCLKAHRVAAERSVISSGLVTGSSSSEDVGAVYSDNEEAYIYQDSITNAQIEGGKEKEDRNVTFLHIAADIEGHVGSDGRFYLIDVARLMPPTPPMHPANKRRPGSFMAELFRAEFLSTHCQSIPLSSDAFSWFGRLDHQEHNQEAKDAFELLLWESVPAAAEALKNVTASTGNDKMGSTQISDLLHSHGVNMRYLGRVYEALSQDDEGNDNVRSVLLREMVSRCVKQRIRRVQRTKAEISPADCLSALLSDSEACEVLYRDVIDKFRFENTAQSIPKSAISTMLQDSQLVEDVRSRVLSSLEYTKSIKLPPFRSLPQVVEELENELSVRRAQLGSDSPLLRDTLQALVDATVLWRVDPSDDDDDVKLEVGKHPATSVQDSSPPAPQEDHISRVSQLALEYITELRRLTTPPVVEASDVEWSSYAWWISVIGRAYHEIGVIEPDRDMTEAALPHVEAHFGESSHRVAVMLSNLGNAYRLLGNLEKVKSLMERSLSITESLVGRDNLEYAITLSNLACTYGDLGDQPRKHKLLEEALTIKEAALGPDHPEVAQTVMNLGVAAGALGDIHRKAELVERALTIYESHFGPEHFQVAATLTNLGVVRGQLGDVVAMRDILERALRIKESHYGPNHYEVAITLTNLAIAYGELGDLQKKIDMLQKALDIDIRQYGENHHDVGLSMAHLAEAYGAIGEAEKMVELQERSLQIMENHFGPNHPQVASLQVNLANTYGAYGVAERMLDLLGSALRTFEVHYGKDHLQTAVTVFNLAQCHAALEQTEKQRECLVESLRVFLLVDHEQYATMAQDALSSLDSPSTACPPPQ